MPALQLTPINFERENIVYLDVWEREIIASEDASLINQNIGIPTCVRFKREWVVRVIEKFSFEGSFTPPTSIKNHCYYVLAITKPNRNGESRSPLVDDQRRIIYPLPLLQQRLQQLEGVEQRLEFLEKAVFAPAFASPEFQPRRSAIDSTVTLNGKNFNVGTPKVTFVGPSGELSAELVSISATSIVVKIPNVQIASRTGFKITVQTDGGKSRLERALPKLSRQERSL